MAGIVAPLLSSFNAGELSETLGGRVDMAKYANGCARLRNFIPLVQGPAKRRSGFKYVAEVPDSSERHWLASFQFSADQNFVLEFGDSTLRFYTNHGILLATGSPAWDIATAYVADQYVTYGGLTYRAIAAGTGNQPDITPAFWTATSIYEITTPYTAAELTNTDGTFKLSMAQTGDVIFIAHPSHPPQQLTRLSNISWTFADAAITQGPFIGVDPDQTTTVYTDAVTGAVNLTASTAIFTTDHIGTLFLMEQRLINDYVAWEPGKAIGGASENQSDGNVYKSLTVGTTGSIKPVHLEGARFDGNPGVQWEYRHSGYGTVLITGIGGGGTTATGTVVGPSELPSDVMTAPKATTRWSFASWSDLQGWPSLVCFFRERLVFARGSKLWFSVTSDFLNFANREGAETVPDSAISIDITTEQLNDAVWMTPVGKLLVGTNSAEFAIGEVSSSDVFSPSNVQAARQTGHGSRQVAPAVINNSVLITGRAGRRLRELRFSFDSDGYQTADMMVLSEDIARGRITQCAFLEEPYSVLWSSCASGELLGFTFNNEQNVQGWHRHPVGNGSSVESVAVIPSPDGSQDELWVIMSKVIDGTLVRSVQYMTADYRSADIAPHDMVFMDWNSSYNGENTGSVTYTATAATWQVDETATITKSAGGFVAGDVGQVIFLGYAAGEIIRFEITLVFGALAICRQMDEVPLAYQATPTTDWATGVITLTGLDYLEGEEIQILGDGATHPNVTVVGGEAELQRAMVVAQVGLACDAEIMTMRIEAGSQNGTAQGKTKRIHRVIVRLMESLGMKIGGYNRDRGEGTLDEVAFRTSADPMNHAPPIFSGDKDVPFPEGYNTDGQMRVVCDTPLPMTVLALMPQLETHDRA